jgi:hypothetical protein
VKKGVFGREFDEVLLVDEDEEESEITEITWDNDESVLFIDIASSKFIPADSVFLILSLPARSTKVKVVLWWKIFSPEYFFSI